MAGGVLVFFSGLFFKRNAFGALRLSSGTEVPPNAMNARPRYMYIFVLGSVFGLVTALLFHVFPDLLSESLATLLEGTSSKVLIVGVLVVSALLSLPFSSLVSVYGLTPSFLISLVVCFIGSSESL